MNLPKQAGDRLHHIGWVLLSPPDAAQPSTRIAALNMMEDLTALGYRSTILFAPDRPLEQPHLPPLDELVGPHDLDIVIFQKVHGESVLAVNGSLRQRGIRTAYMVCDLVMPALTEATDLTITVTPFLRELYPPSLRHKIAVVHDGIEHPDLHKEIYSDRRGERHDPLNAVLITSAKLHKLDPIGLPPPWLQTTVVGGYPEQPSLRQRYWDLAVLPDLSTRLDYLRFVSHPRIHAEAWSEFRAYEAMLSADIGVIPVPAEPTAEAGELPPMWMRKSENRLTMKMALGLPVVASPVPAYLDIVDQGVNGFIATTPAEWHRCLAELRDPSLRRSMGLRARQSVLERFSRQRQAALLAEALDALATTTTSAL